MGYSKLDDQQVVAAMALGDADALGCLYDRYGQLLLAVACKMLSDRAAAEDLLHDVLMEAFRNAARYDGGRASVRTWLLVRLRSRGLDQLRSASTRKHIQARILKEELGSPDLCTAVEVTADEQRVRTALSTLSDSQRQVLELGYFQGLSSAEIAEVMGSPVGTVKSRTAAALAHLRQQLRIEG